MALGYCDLCGRHETKHATTGCNLTFAEAERLLRRIWLQPKPDDCTDPACKHPLVLHQGMHQNGVCAFPGCRCQAHRAPVSLPDPG